jgi:hypothetical protein
MKSRSARLNCPAFSRQWSGGNPMDHVISHVLRNSGATVRALSDGAFACAVPGDRAAESWRLLRDAIPVTGCYPIIIGNVTKLESFESNWRLSALDASETESTPVDVAEWIEAKIEEMIADFEDDAEAPETPPRGPWPSETTHSPDYASVMNTAGTRHLGLVGIVLLPTADPFQVPRAMAFGGWNDCPEPSVHEAFIRYWNEKYGAELVAITDDVVEMYVARPPASRDEAINLALEQYAYCSDIVDQGTETVDRLAAEILGQPRWFFWWD